MIWKKLLLFNIFILPFSFALNPTSTIDLSLLRASVPLTTFFWIFHQLKVARLPKKPLPSTTTFLLLLFLIFSTLSFFWTSSQSFAIRKIVFLVSMSSFYFPAKNFFTENPDSFKIFTKIITFSIFFLTSFSLFIFSLQFLIGLDSTLDLMANTISPFFLGKNFSNLVRAYPSWLVNISGETRLRTVGSFPDPHLLAIYLNLCWPIIAYGWIKNKRPFFLICLALSIITIFFSFSRAAYLAMMTSILFLLAHPLSLKTIKKNKIFFLTILIGLSILTLPISPIGNRFWDSFNLQEGSNSGRIKMWKKSTEAFYLHPFSGLGISGFPTFVNPSVKEKNPIYAHNLFLDFSAELGIIGLITTSLLILKPIAKYFKNPNNKNFFIATTFIALFISCLFETPFYSVNVFPLIIILLAL